MPRDVSAPIKAKEPTPEGKEPTPKSKPSPPSGPAKQDQDPRPAAPKSTTKTTTKTTTKASDKQKPYSRPPSTAKTPATTTKPTNKEKPSPRPKFKEELESSLARLQKMNAAGQARGLSPWEDGGGSALLCLHAIVKRENATFRLPEFDTAADHETLARSMGALEREVKVLLELLTRRKNAALNALEDCVAAKARAKRLAKGGKA
ncbi:hypothetical protein Q8F55_004114 [Vanrija albida]|uniref:BAG domain-containing protein n=1 Tax=Vanrija albida TaxID=181172 RepID=A0ABR3Q5W0_9TREE